ncbi:uncharacterized protein DS421_16g565170 [Arachis hypogaea]|nr:uncharacterized protein DS421_16g565170 [Arachis hypogaea]
MMVKDLSQRGLIHLNHQTTREMVLTWPQFNEEADFGDVQPQLNMEFTTLEQFKHALKDYTIAEGRRIFYVKNDNRRVRCKCASGKEKAMIAKVKCKAKCKAKRKENDAAEANNSGEKQKESNAENNGGSGTKDTRTVKANALVTEVAAMTNETGGNETAIVPSSNANECPWLIYCA